MYPRRCAGPHVLRRLALHTEVHRPDFTIARQQLSLILLVKLRPSRRVALGLIRDAQPREPVLNRPPTCGVPGFRATAFGAHLRFVRPRVDVRDGQPAARGGSVFLAERSGNIEPPLCLDLPRPCRAVVGGVAGQSPLGIAHLRPRQFGGERFGSSLRVKVRARGAAHARIVQDRRAPVQRDDFALQVLADLAVLVGLRLQLLRVLIFELDDLLHPLGIAGVGLVIFTPSALITDHPSAGVELCAVDAIDRPARVRDHVAEQWDLANGDHIGAGRINTTPAATTSADDGERTRQRSFTIARQPLRSRLARNDGASRNVATPAASTATAVAASARHSARCSVHDGNRDRVGVRHRLRRRDRRA
jgi:hypothetical protein